MTIVGVGAQGGLDDADRFLAETGIVSAPVVWDADFRVWSHYDVPSQPAAVLVDAEGRALHTWRGRFDPEDVLRRAGVG